MDLTSQLHSQTMLHHQLSPARFDALFKSADSSGPLHQLLQLEIRERLLELYKYSLH
jgi:hypothetical protein